MPTGSSGPNRQRSGIEVGVDAAGTHGDVLRAQAAALAAGHLAVGDGRRRAAPMSPVAGRPLWPPMSPRGRCRHRGCRTGEAGRTRQARPQPALAPISRTTQATSGMASVTMTGGRARSRWRAQAAHGLLHEAVRQQRGHDRCGRRDDEHQGRFGNSSAVNTMIGQCHRYQEYEMSPMKTIGRVARAALTPGGVVRPGEDEEHGAGHGQQCDHSGERLRLVDDEGGRGEAASTDPPGRPRDRGRRHGDADEQQGEQGSRGELPRAGEGGVEGEGLRAAEEGR